MKKLFCILLSVLLLLSMGVSAPALAAIEDPEVNLLRNGDFESIGSSGWFSYWNQCCRPTCEHSAVDQDIFYEGDASLHVINPGISPVQAYQSVTGLIAGATYTISGYVRVDGAGKTSMDGTGATFSITCVIPGAQSTSESSGLYSDTSGQFVYKSFTFTLPNKCTSIEVLCRMFSEGSAWFDNLELHLTSLPEKYSFSFSDVFHYSHEKTGHAAVELSSYYAGKPIETEARINFSIKDGDRVLYEQKDVAFTDAKATFTYDISILAEKKKAYTLSATAKWNGEEKTFTQNIYVYDRPTMIGDDGLIRIEGEVFNPVIGFAVRDFTWDKLEGSGINVVQWSGFSRTEEELQIIDEYLGHLDEHGLKAYFILYHGMKPAGHPDNIEGTKKAVERFKNDPRIFAWAIMDEPFKDNPTDEERAILEASYKAVRDIDSMHPVHLTGIYSEPQKYCDIYSVDAYHNSDDTQAISRIIAEKRDAQMGEVYRQYIGSTFTYSSDPASLPTEKQVRSCAYRAFEEGVKGIGYYCISVPVNGDLNQPLYSLPLWGPLCKFNTTELPVLFDIFVNQKYKKLNECQEGARYNYNGTYWSTWTDGEVVYMIVHNKSMEEKTITPSLKSANGMISIGAHTIERIGGTATIPTTGTDQFAITLPLQDVVLYKITPNTPLDLTALDKTNLFPVPDFDQEIGAYGWLGTGIATQAGGADGSAKCLAIAAGKNASYTGIAVDDVKSYTLSFKYKATGAVTASVGVDTFTSGGADVGAFGVALADTTDSTGAWKEKKMQFTTPKNASTFKINISNTSTSGTLCLDSFVLYADGDVPNFILNGSCDELSGDGKMDAWKPHDKDVVYTPGVGYRTGVQGSYKTLSWVEEEDGNGHALKLTVGATGTNFSDMLVPMMTGGLSAGNYKLSFKAKTDNLLLKPSIRFYDTVIPNVPSESINIADGNVAANQWQEFVYRFTLTQTTAITAWLMYLPSATGTIYFDDFMLTLDTPSAELCAGVKTGEGTTGGECVIPATTLSGITPEADGTRRVSARVHFVPETGVAENRTVVTCVYKHENGQVSLESVSLQTGYNITAPTTITDTVVVPKIEGGTSYTVESFVWNTLQDMKPVRETMVLAN